MEKTKQKQFRIEKVMKKKGDQLYVKLEGYNKLLNSWIDKKSNEYFPKLKFVGANVKNELHLFNYQKQI